MKHRGEIVEKAVRENGISISALAKRLNKSRQYVYNIFENPNVPVETILLIGKLIHHDFTNDIKELKINIISPNTPNNNGNFNDNDPAVYNSVNYWKNKYLELLEKYNLLLQQLLDKTRMKK